ncbi:MAG: Transcriptional regulator [Holophagaceae bacterium]|nr:Transcriptional regulator [Holophagaceae bacterium]
MDTPESPSSCQVFRKTVDLLAKPWTGQILWTLQEGPLRFNEIATRVTGIGEKVLSARLKELESQGLLARHVFPTTPVKVEYKLTCKGCGFQQVVEAITSWGSMIAEPGEKPD